VPGRRSEELGRLTVVLPRLVVLLELRFVPSGFWNILRTVERAGELSDDRVRDVPRLSEP
jgi:hypothetical protein